MSICFVVLPLCPLWVAVRAALGPNCTHVSDDCVPTNATVWGVAAREFLKVMRQVYPAISRAHLLVRVPIGGCLSVAIAVRLLTRARVRVNVRAQNEPNAHWWKIDHVGTNVPFNGSDYAKFFNEAAAAIHAGMPSLSLGGPVTWCPPSGSRCVVCARVCVGVAFGWARARTFVSVSRLAYTANACGVQHRRGFGFLPALAMNIKSQHVVSRGPQCGAQ